MKWIAGAVVLVVVAFVVFTQVTKVDAVPARWYVPDEAELDPSARKVRILVMEDGCTTGSSAEGRIEVSVDERDDEVELDVSVRPLGGGDQGCAGNPVTPYIVELDEPLGDRRIVGQAPF